MVLLSTLRQRCQSMQISRLLKPSPQLGYVLKRHGGHGHFEVVPSEFNWKKTKDLFHFYTCIAFLLYSPIILYFNIFVGSATLIEIPEGYRPHHWEYYKHPISRAIQKYCYEDPQENYEKFLQFLHEEDEQQKVRELDVQIDRVMKKYKDYEAYYYTPLKIIANVIRIDRKDGDDYQWDSEILTFSGFPTNLDDKDSSLTKEFKDVPVSVEE